MKGFKIDVNSARKAKTRNDGKVASRYVSTRETIVNKVDINIIQSQSENEFCLLISWKKEYKVKFKEAILLFKRVSTTTSAVAGIEKALERDRAKYVVDNVDCKAITVPPGNCSVIEDRVFQGKIPNRASLSL